MFKIKISIMATAKSNLDKELFGSMNNTKKIESPIQTVVHIEPVKPKKEEVDLVGLFARVPAVLKKQIKTYSVVNEITQDALVTKILQSFFENKEYKP